MKRIQLLVGSIVVISTIFGASTAMASQNCNTIRYFTDTKKGFPYFPVNEIDEKQTQELNTYLEGCFNDEGKLVKLRKILNNDVYFVHIYEYEGENLKRVKRINESGDATTIVEY